MRVLSFRHSTLLAFVGVAIVVIALVFFYGSTNQTGLVLLPEQQSTIKIGMMLHLTGDAASWGQAVKNGIDLAFDEIKNEKINGKTIELVFEDDRCDAATAVSAFQKLTQVDGIKITGATVCSGVVLAIAPIVEKENSLHLSAGASNDTISEAGDYIFRIWPSDTFEVTKLSEFAFDHLKIRKVAILNLNNDYALGLKNSFSTIFTEKGGIITSAQYFDTDDDDFKTQLLKINESNPDAIYVASNPTQMPLILKQIKAFGMNQLILANSGGIESGVMLEENAELGNGVIYAIPKTKISAEFNKKYVDQFGKDSPFLPPYGFDVVMLLSDAIKQCQSDDPDCIKAYLYSVRDYSGASGIISFDKKGDVVVPIEIRVIKDGVPVPYSAN